ncbi:MAG: peptidoglycan editing factor PgeF [Rhodocyclaceae bacterium]|jgi:YfiH family protein
MNDWIVPDWPAPAGVRALVTTRSGGVSTGPYASMNLAEHVGDDPGFVAENRCRLRTHLPAEPLWLSQVHGHAVVCAEDAVEGVAADAAFTRRAGRVCAVLTADCLPVLLCNDAGTVVAAAHAGWRGLAGGVIEATLRAMNEPPAHLLAWLGPAIGPQAFEVGAEVRAAFLAHSPDAAAAFAAQENGKWLADLYRLAGLRLHGLGVERVFGGGFCTCRDPQRFYSFRREKTTGRMATLIWME